MKKQGVLILTAIIIGLYGHSQNIPITTKSSEALEQYIKGWQLENHLRLNEAEAMYRKAIALDSTFALAHLRLGMVKDNYEFRRTQIKQAIKHCDAVSEGEKLWIKAQQDVYSIGFDGTKEYSYFQELVKAYPNDAIANYLFGFANIHHSGNDPELAILHFEKAIQLDPNFIKPYNELTYAYMDVSNLEKAKEAATNYVKVLPESVDPLDTYAEVLMRNGEYEKSIGVYKNVLDKDPEFPWAFVGIAANMNFLGRHQEGRTYSKRIQESGLSDYEYRHKWRALITSYIDEGNLKEAKRILEQQKQTSLKGLNKREPTFHIYYSFLRKTRLYFESGEADKGYSEYENWKRYVDTQLESKVAKKRLKNLEFYYKAYRAYLKNKSDQAIKELERYNALNEREADKERAKVLLAKVYMNKQMYPEAIKTLRETKLNRPYYQYWLMMALLKNGALEEAKEWRSKIINLNDRNNIGLSLVRQKALDLKL